MSLRANGAKLLWAGYEFGAGYPENDLAEPCESLDDAKFVAEATGMVVKFRSRYVSEWFPADPHMGFADEG